MSRMTRRSNPTGLLDVPNKNVQISLVDVGKERHFSLTKMDLGGKVVPGDAKVICVARSGRSSQRFELGRLDSWDRTPQVLSDLDVAEALSFRVLIRPAASPRLLASAENIRLRDQTQGESLLPIEVAELGQVAWKLDLENDDGPILLVNQSVYPSAAIAENDAQFVALVLPEAIRQICECLMEEPDGLEDEGDWRSQWAEWLVTLGAFLPPPSATETAAAAGWAADVVDRFCNRHMFCTKLQRQRDAAGDGA